jgi:hypothetical protein
VPRRSAGRLRPGKLALGQPGELGAGARQPGADRAHRDAQGLGRLRVAEPGPDAEGENLELGPRQAGQRPVQRVDPGGVVEPARRVVGEVRQLVGDRQPGEGGPVPPRRPALAAGKVGRDPEQPARAAASPRPPRSRPGGATPRGTSSTSPLRPPTSPRSAGRRGCRPIWRTRRRPRRTRPRPRPARVPAIATLDRPHPSTGSADPSSSRDLRHILPASHPARTGSCPGSRRLLSCSGPAGRR